MSDASHPGDCPSFAPAGATAVHSDASFQRLLRRAELLAQCAAVLNAQLDIGAATQGLAEHVRSLLDAIAVAVCIRENDCFVLHGVAGITPEMAAEVRQRHAAGCLRATELAMRAADAGGPITAQSEDHSSGEILAAPIRTTRTIGALLVFRAPGAKTCPEDIALVEAVARLGAMAISNAELYATANEHARELQQLLDISSELGAVGDRDKFLEKFVVRAAEFLDFARSFIALNDGGSCQVRWMAESGTAKPLNFTLPERVRHKILEKRDAFWSDDVSGLPNADQQLISTFQIRQYLAVPLLGMDGKPLGMLGVLDRNRGGAISPEDVRRAKALAAGVAVVLEAAQNLYLSQQNRRRAEDLTSIALELSSSLRLPQFVRSFTQRAADVLHARAAVLALAQGATLEAVVFHDEASRPSDRVVVRRLNMALTAMAAESSELVRMAPAAEFFGAELAAQLGWTSVVVARLNGLQGDLLGVLCLADCGPDASVERNLLQGLAAHASVALENARLFTRMDQANRHWMEIFDSISDFIVVHDHGNNVLRVNRSLADFIGLRPAQLIGISMRALISMAADATGIKACPFCRADGEATDEYVHPVLDRTYLVSTSCIHGALNEGMQTIHVLKDITDRREAERRYRELFNNIQEGLFFSSPDGRFIEVNDALVRMLGYDTREELLEVDISNSLYTDSQGRERFEAAVAKNGWVLRNFEETLRRKDGRIIYTLQNAFAVRDAKGRVVQYRGLMLDITELKNFQVELQRERDFSSKILNNTQSLILVVDTAGLISYANRRCYVAGNYRESDLLGRRLIDLILPQRRDRMAHAVELCLLGQQVDNLELPIMLGNGRTGQFSINLSPMRDEQGTVISIVVVMTDITDAAMLQAKLMHTEKMAAVGQLVSGVAHEVNNPLTAVLGFTDLLLDNAEVPLAAKKDLGIILQEAQRTKQIVQNLLSFARQMPPQRQPVQINAILRRTLALRSYDFANHDIKVVERFDSALPEVIGDAHQLQQVFLNILNNAYDAVREAGRPGDIQVETSATAARAEIRFRDNGPGITYPDRIFDPFFTTKEVGKGTGLGLSICYGIVNEHGGEIACQNNDGEPGATFVVRLPFAAMAAGTGGQE